MKRTQAGKKVHPREHLILVRTGGVAGLLLTLQRGPMSVANYKEHVWSNLQDLALKYWEHLYAELNGRHAAATILQELEGELEYEFPFMLLYPVKGLKNRQKVVDRFLQKLPATMRKMWGWAERPYHNEEARPEFHVKKLKRPKLSQAKTFLAWVDEVVASTFEADQRTRSFMSQILSIEVPE